MKIKALLLSVVGCSQAMAMMCTPADISDITERAGVIFVGKAIHREPSQYNPHGICWERSSQKRRCGGKIVTFEVQKRFKGDFEELPTVLFEDGCYCLGSYIDVGEMYLVIANSNTTGFDAVFLAENVCSGTGSVKTDRAQEIISQLEENETTLVEEAPNK